MPRPIKKWPDYALNSLEGTLFHLKTIQRLSREAQKAAEGGDPLQAVILNGDIRDEALNAVHLLVQARTGEYEQPITTFIT